MTRSRKRQNDYQWIVESLEDRPSFTQKQMMGCQLIGLDGKQQLVLADREPPFNGLLICTSVEHHESLRSEFPALRPHPVLKKWVYLEPQSEDFEQTALAITEKVLKGDPRIGVISKPRKRASKKKA